MLRLLNIWWDIPTIFLKSFAPHRVKKRNSLMLVTWTWHHWGCRKQRRMGKRRKGHKKCWNGEGEKSWEQTFPVSYFCTGPGLSLNECSANNANKCEFLFCHLHFTFLNHFFLPYFDNKLVLIFPSLTLYHLSLRSAYEMLNRNINQTAFGRFLPDSHPPSTHDIYWLCRKQWYHVVLTDSKLSENHAKDLNHVSCYFYT